MFRKFLKEKSGGVIEVIFLLAFAGTLLVVLSPSLRTHIYNLYASVSGQIDSGTTNKTYFDKNGKPVISSVGYKSFTLGIKTYASTKMYTTGTQFQFAADVSGGSGSFTYTWQNYNGDISGKLGPPQNYNPGNYTVFLTAKDNASGVSKQVSYNFTVVSGPQVNNLVVYDMGGAVVTTPYTNTDYKIGITVTGGSVNDYTCFWDSDITITGYNNTKTDPCNASATFKFMAPQSIPINVTVCFKIDPNNCKVLAQTLEIVYSPVYLVNSAIVANPSKGWYATTEGITFSAAGSGGSGNLRIEWQNYNGDADQNGTGNGAQTYSIGANTVQGRACDNLPPYGRCSSWAPYTFNVGNPVSFNLASNPTSAKTNTNIDLTVSAVAGGSSGYMYYWSITDYGNTVYSTNNALPRSFSTTGTKTVTVQVCDAYNSSNCATKTIYLTIENPPQPTNFTYTGGVQTYTVVQTGTYKLETWGAQGGGDSSYSGGLGGYTAANVNLTAGQSLEVYVGGSGGFSNASPGGSGGYNGGGYGWGGTGYTGGGGGGGATDMRMAGSTVSTPLYNWDFTSGLNGFTSGSTSIFFSNSSLMSNINTTDGWFYAPPVSFTGNSTDTIQISVKNNSPNTGGQIYFTTGNSPSYAQSHVVQFNMSAYNSGYTVYTINMNGSPNWNNQTITGLRFDIANDVTASGSFQVNNIKVNRTTTSSSKIIVAGGGGGGAYTCWGNVGGAGGGLTGGNGGAIATGIAGIGGGQNAGGSAVSGSTNSGAGTLGQGGSPSGSTNVCSSGGGGGGWYGGSSGGSYQPHSSGYGGSGGGGSSYYGSLTSPDVKQGVRSGNGYAAITKQ